MNPPKYFLPPLAFLHPVVKLLLVVNMIANTNTVHIFVVVIIDVQSQKIHLTHRTSNSIKYRTNLCGPKNGNTTHGNKMHRVHVINILSDKVLNITD